MISLIPIKLNMKSTNTNVENFIINEKLMRKLFKSNVYTLDSIDIDTKLEIL